tara:strand:- start:1806 stop:1997 length:192 start_codon:yes stop_codon:yes gene_type:complete
MKNKFTDQDLMAFADGELKGGVAMDILGILVDKSEGYEELRKRLQVYTKTRHALINSLLGEDK